MIGTDAYGPGHSVSMDDIEDGSASGDKRPRKQAGLETYYNLHLILRHVFI
jgi:hypothetical protein